MNFRLKWFLFPILAGEIVLIGVTSIYAVQISFSFCSKIDRQLTIALGVGREQIIKIDWNPANELLKLCMPFAGSEEMIAELSVDKILETVISSEYVDFRENIYTSVWNDIWIKSALCMQVVKNGGELVQITKQIII